MANWELKEVKESIEENLNGVGVDIIPKQVYKKEFKGILEEYKNILEDNNFCVELNEPEDTGLINGAVETSLEVKSFKLPNEGYYAGESSYKVEFSISAKSREVTVRQQMGTDEEDEENHSISLEKFSRGDIERALDDFTVGLKDKIQE